MSAARADAKRAAAWFRNAVLKTEASLTPVGLKLPTHKSKRGFLQRRACETSQSVLHSFGNGRRTTDCTQREAYFAPWVDPKRLTRLLITVSAFAFAWLLLEGRARPSINAVLVGWLLHRSSSGGCVADGRRGCGMYSRARACGVNGGGASSGGHRPPRKGWRRWHLRLLPRPSVEQKSRREVPNNARCELQAAPGRPAPAW